MKVDINRADIEYTSLFGEKMIYRYIESSK